MDTSPGDSLVSIIIPCYNAARWVAEAVDSCLAQTYTPVEVIVVDDGSTDESVAILRRYGERIRLVTQANSGGNCARNRGFALSQGAYIQFLDADDYLLPEKIARQVSFLAETGADVVYGDWRHQCESPVGAPTLSPVQVSGAQDDVLAALLRGWWTANHSILFRREVVTAVGGWDESIQAGQDRDFFQSVALTGADIRYQPGCYAIYRRYGHVTVSTGNRQKWLENHEKILHKAEQQLQETGCWTLPYRQALAHSYFHLARNYYERDKEKQRRLYEKVRQLDPHFVPQESAVYNAAYQFLGFPLAERLAGTFRQVRKLRRRATQHEASIR